MYKVSVGILIRKNGNKYFPIKTVQTLSLYYSYVKTLLMHYVIVQAHYDTNTEN